MIFVTLGTQKFEFNRMLEYIDKLIEEKIILEDVIAQVGFSKYQPKNYKKFEFIASHDFEELVKKCSIYITHCGVGSVMVGKKWDKPTIVIPRMSKYKEHIDDHQLQIAQKYSDLGYVFYCCDYESLKATLKNIESKSFKPLLTNDNSKISNKIMEFINNN